MKLTPQQVEFRKKWIVLFTALEALILTGIKLVFALYTGSAALLADAIHSATDVVGLFIVWIGVRFASYKSKRFPYGAYKIENLFALAIGFAIFYAAYEILNIAIRGDSVLPDNVYAGIAAVLVAIVMDFFWGRYVAKTGKLIQSPGIEASGSHTLSDVYSSSVVLIGLVSALWGVNVDRWAALFVAIIIAKIGFEILWNNLKVLLDISLSKEQLDTYTKLIELQPGVISVKSIIGRNAGCYRFLHIGIALKAHEVTLANGIIDKVTKALKKEDASIDQVFIHYEHEFPRIVLISLATDEDGTVMSDHFGKASHLTHVQYDRETRQCITSVTEPNLYKDNTKHRGIMLAESLIDKGTDTVCCREDLSDKGPGLMFHRFGVDTRTTEETSVEIILKDYFEQSASVFRKKSMELQQEVNSQPLMNKTDSEA